MIVKFVSGVDASMPQLFVMVVNRCWPVDYSHLCTYLSVERSPVRDDDNYVAIVTEPPSRPFQKGYWVLNVFEDVS